MSISGTGNATLDGLNQGDGSHLAGRTITLQSLSLTEVFVNDTGGSETNFADNDGTQRLDGPQTIDGVLYTGNPRIEAEYQFTVRDDATGLDYTIIAVNVNNSSRPYGTNEAIAFVDTPPPINVPLRVITAGEGPPNTGTRSLEENEVFAPCLCRGSRIHLHNGVARVEDLKEGAQVLRSDHSIATLRRVFRTTLTADQLVQQPKLRPIRITAGALGDGLPLHDLCVSRQHRMLVSSKIAERMFGVRDVLIPAIKLTKLPGIYVDEDVKEVEYFHLLFDRHEVIFAEGAPTESLFTGPEALKALGAEARAEILTLFPNLAQPGQTGAPARYIPPLKRQNQLIARHLKNRRPVLAQSGAV